jgi:hypothetical protein
MSVLGTWIFGAVLGGQSQVGGHGGFGWGEVEVPVTEAAHGVGDQWGHRGQVDRVHGVAVAGEGVGAVVMSRAVWYSTQLASS